MTNIDASALDYRQLNAAIRDCAGAAAVTVMARGIYTVR